MGKLPSPDDAARVGLMKCLTETGEPRVIEATLGIPGGLALLAEEALLIRQDDPADAATMARDWVDAPAIGTDMTMVATRLVTWLFERVADADVLPVDDLPRCFGFVRDLHLRVLRGETIGRAEWAAARTEALAATDQEGDARRQLVAKFAETMAWPAATARTMLIEGARLYGSICAAAEEGRSDTTGDQRIEIHRVMDQLFTETAVMREADPGLFFPDLFAELHPELSARFVRDLDAANAAYVGGIVECAAHAILLMRAAAA